jgi:hypothetical protein
MKKTLITVCILAVMPLLGNAQQWLTVKGGGGISTMLGYSGSNGSIQTGISTSFGIGYKHQLSKRLMIEGDILLDGRAMEYPTSLVDEDDKIIYFLAGGSYINVPLTLQYQIPFKKKELIPYRMGQPKSFWFIEGGPYFSYGAAVTPFIDDDIIASFAGGKDSITKADLEPRTFDIGIVGGIGVNFSIRDGKNRLIVGTRVNYGMINLYRNEQLGTATNFSAVGYLAVDFSLTKRKHIRHRW